MFTQPYQDNVHGLGTSLQIWTPVLEALGQGLLEPGAWGMKRGGQASRSWWEAAA